MARKAKFAPVHTPDGPEVQKRCQTCAKNSINDNYCQVLKERIGMTKDCWAWSDDPEWEAKVERAVNRYRDGYRG